MSDGSSCNSCIPLQPAPSCAAASITVLHNGAADPHSEWSETAIGLAIGLAISPFVWLHSEGCRIIESKEHNFPQVARSKRTILLESTDSKLDYASANDMAARRPNKKTAGQAALKLYRTAPNGGPRGIAYSTRPKARACLCKGVLN